MTDTVIDRRNLLALISVAVAVPLVAPTVAKAAPAGSLAVIATIVAVPDKASALRAVLHDLAAAARNEKGCLSYLVYEDKNASGHFYTYEHWTGDAALDAHLASPSMKAAGAKFGAMLASPPVIARLTAV